MTKLKLLILNTINLQCIERTSPDSWYAVRFAHPNHSLRFGLRIPAKRCPRLPEALMRAYIKPLNILNNEGVKDGN